eukprot:TRINITY_DN4868_c0_g1_i1.p1 TRINITY_DN4868_c0_g1~~TRINITY_DN4868_c0_g1_i1.p1  ORF type:complete len:281 (+),score=33.37 TRINITY_DN4868_c0_g1_i1:73-843(+)
MLHTNRCVVLLLLVVAVLPYVVHCQNGAHLRFVNAQVAYSDPLLLKFTNVGETAYAPTVSSPGFTPFSVVLEANYQAEFEVIDIFTGTIFSTTGVYDSGYGSLLFYGGTADNAKATPKYTHSVVSLSWMEMPELLHFPGLFNTSFRLVNLWENTVTAAPLLTAVVNGVPMGGNNSNSAAFFVGVGQYTTDWSITYDGPSYFIELYDQDSNFLAQGTFTNLQFNSPYDIYVLPTIFNNQVYPYPTIQVVPQSDIGNY